MKSSASQLRKHARMTFSQQQDHTYARPRDGVVTGTCVIDRTIDRAWSNAAIIPDITRALQ